MLIDNRSEAVSQRLRPALIAIGLLLLASKESYTLASEPLVQQTQVESEFTSIEVARVAEKKLLALSDAVVPAVVKLSGTGGEEKLHHGSGVVIHPSGLILTHGHHDQPRGTKVRATFPDSLVVEASVESVFSGGGRDFSLLKIQEPGKYPSVPLRRELPPVAGERCFHLGYPGKLIDVTTLSTPLLRLGRIAGTGRCTTYANCLIASGDSGGPLFDFDGRLIGILDLSIGPNLRHPGSWADISRILDGATFLTEDDNEEPVRLGFTNNQRQAIDTQRHLANKLGPELLAPARQATVDVLVDGQVTILGTIVDPNGIVLTKRSEIMTHRGSPLGKLSCRLFDGEEVSSKVIANSYEDDVALLQLPKRGLTSAPLSPHEEPRRGVIVVVPVPGQDLSETGVLSVNHPLKIEPGLGHLTLAVEMKEAGLTITNAPGDPDFTKLMMGSIKEGDVITHVDGEVTLDLATYEKQTKNTFIAGEFVMLSVRRNGATSQVAMPVDSGSIAAHSYADVSLRQTGFPAVLIHDTIVGGRQCGGPVVDLDGRVVGVNIARFHRCSTFAIPQQEIRRLVHKLLKDTPR